MFSKTNRKTAKYEMDMCSGPILPKMITLTVPIIISGILQLLFNTVDTMVVGRFVGKEALAAVGSTGFLISLLISLFMGLSMGTNVLAARAYGAQKKKDMSDVVHTAVAASFLCGFILLFVGMLVAEPALRIMGTPPDVIEYAVLYMKIYFCGIPFSMAYNFGSAVMRAVGDTKRPMYYLTVAGIVNVCLNLILVIVFNMGVAGVAWSTVTSHAISSFLVLRCLTKMDNDYCLEVKKIRIQKSKLIEMIKIGLPAGIQSVLFSFSNTLIQSSINSFGSIVVAGNTAAQNLTSFISTSVAAVQTSTITFTSQNYGGRKYKRLGKVFCTAELMVFVIGVIIGGIVLLFSSQLLTLYTTDPQVIEIGKIRLQILCCTYFLCGMMEVGSAAMRGIGYSMLPTVVTLIGSCAFRVLWVVTVFQKIHTLECLYWSYPISWGLTFLAHLICFLFVYKTKLKPNE